MFAYIMSGIIFVMVFIYILLEKVLYKTPSDNRYFTNVGNVDVYKNKMIAADPKYVLIISFLTGILIGILIALNSLYEIESPYVTGAILLLLITYMKEITRTIQIEEHKLILSDFLMFTKEIDPGQISGMYIYSYNKKYLKMNAYTTKLVITEKSGKTTKFVLSSVDIKAVQNMMKDNFGVKDHKIYIQKRNDEIN